MLLPSSEPAISAAVPAAAKDSAKRETAAHRQLQESFLDVFSGPAQSVTKLSYHPSAQSLKLSDILATQSFAAALLVQVGSN